MKSESQAFTLLFVRMNFFILFSLEVLALAPGLCETHAYLYL
jgi:hypothetical protein